jgi:hypothetical protein
MHEHVCQQLIWHEIVCKKEVQSQQAIQVYTMHFNNVHAKEAECIDDEYVFGYGRHHVHVEYVLNL